MSAYRASTFLASVSLTFLIYGCVHPFEEAYEAAGGPASTGPAKPVPQVCPDRTGTRLYTPNGQSGWIPTRCEAVIIKAAIDYCIGQTTKTDHLENVINRLQTAGASLVTLSAAAAGVAGLAVGSPPLAIAGSATLIANLSGDLGKVFSGSEPTVTVANMIAAAQQYSMLNQNLVVPVNDAGTNNAFYAGLWNAAGSACPQNLLGGSFKAASFDNTSIPNQFYTPISITYSVTDHDTVPTIASAIETALLGNADIRQAKIQIAIDGGVITLTPPSTATQLTLDKIVTPASGQTAAKVKVEITNSTNAVTVTVSLTGSAQKGDAITISGSLLD